MTNDAKKLIEHLNKGVGGKDYLAVDLDWTEGHLLDVLDEVIAARFIDRTTDIVRDESGRVVTIFLNARGKEFNG